MQGRACRRIGRRRIRIVHLLLGLGKVLHFQGKPVDAVVQRGPLPLPQNLPQPGLGYFPGPGKQGFLPGGVGPEYPPQHFGAKGYIRAGRDIAAVIHDGPRRGNFQRRQIKAVVLPERQLDGPGGVEFVPDLHAAAGMQFKPVRLGSRIVIIRVLHRRVYAPRAEIKPGFVRLLVHPEHPGLPPRLIRLVPGKHVQIIIGLIGKKRGVDPEGVAVDHAARRRRIAAVCGIRIPQVFPVRRQHPLDCGVDRFVHHKPLLFPQAVPAGPQPRRRIGDQHLGYDHAVHRVPVKGKAGTGGLHARVPRNPVQRDLRVRGVDADGKIPVRITPAPAPGPGRKRVIPLPVQPRRGRIGKVFRRRRLPPDPFGVVPLHIGLVQVPLFRVPQLRPLYVPAVARADPQHKTAPLEARQPVDQIVRLLRRGRGRQADQGEFLDRLEVDFHVPVLRQGIGVEFFGVDKFLPVPAPHLHLKTVIGVRGKVLALQYVSRFVPLFQGPGKTRGTQPRLGNLRRKPPVFYRPVIRRHAAVLLRGPEADLGAVRRFRVYTPQVQGLAFQVPPGVQGPAQPFFPGRVKGRRRGVRPVKQPD